MLEITKNLYWFKQLDILLTHLPDPGAKWTANFRGRWLYALETLLDVLIPVGENEQEKRFGASKVWRGES